MAAHAVLVRTPAQRGLAYAVRGERSGQGLQPAAPPMGAAPVPCTASALAGQLVPGVAGCCA